MENLDKIIDCALKEDFVGNSIISSKQLDNLYEDVSDLLRSYAIKKRNFTYDVYKKIFVAVVNIAKTWEHEESAFFEYVIKKLVGDVSDISTDTNLKKNNIYNIIVDSIKSLNKNGDIKILNGAKKSNYATILAHSFAPISSIESFFELCWKIYSEDMDFDFYDDDPIFNDVVKQLKTFIKKNETDDDSINLGSNVYQLRAGIKGLVLSDEEAMIELIKNIIGTIDNLFNNVKEDNDNYLNRIIINWWVNYYKSLGNVSCIRKRHERIVTDYSNINAKFKIIDDEVCLYIPPIRIVNDSTYTPILTVYVDDTQIMNILMTQFGSGLFSNTEEQIFKLKSFKFNTDEINIQINIFNNGKLIYDSKNKLKRDSILFKDYKEVTNSNCLPGNYELYTLDINNISIKPELFRMKSNNYYSMACEDKDILKTKNRTYIFAENHMDNNIYFDIPKVIGIQYVKNNIEYNIIKGEAEIFLNNLINDKQYGVKINDAIFNLSDFTRTILNNSYSSYNITEPLLDGEEQSLTIFEFASNKIIDTINIIKFEKFEMNYDKAYYYGENRNGVLKISSNKYNNEVKFNINSINYIIPFNDGEFIYVPPIISWSIDNGLIHTSPDKKGIFYGNITDSSIFNLNIPNSINAQLISNTTNKIIPINEHKYKIGNFAYNYANNNIKNKLDFILLFLSNDKGLPIELFKIHFKEFFSISPINISVNKIMYWNPSMSFIGNNNTKFNIKIFRDDNVVFDAVKSIDTEEIDLNDIETGNYSIEISKKGNIFIKESTILYKEDNVFIGDRRLIRFNNKTLKITKAVMNDPKTRVPEENINSLQLDNLEYMGNEKGFDFYKGRLIKVNKSNVAIPFISMKNDDGGIDYINPVRIELKDNKSLWMVYGLKSDNLEDNDFEAEFTLDNNNLLSISDKNTYAINYYKFEERGK